MKKQLKVFNIECKHKYAWLPKKVESKWIWLCNYIKCGNKSFLLSTFLNKIKNFKITIDIEVDVKTKKGVP
jgi:hypothetical protein